MYIVKHKESGKFFKRGNHRSHWGAKLVDRDKATIFRSTSGIKNCLGSLVKLDQPIVKKGGHKQFVKMVLDEETWEIVPITF